MFNSLVVHAQAFHFILICPHLAVAPLGTIVECRILVFVRSAAYQCRSAAMYLIVAFISCLQSLEVTIDNYRSVYIYRQDIHICVYFRNQFIGRIHISMLHL